MKVGRTCVKSSSFFVPRITERIFFFNVQTLHVPPSFKTGYQDMFKHLFFQMSKFFKTTKWIKFLKSKIYFTMSISSE